MSRRYKIIIAIIAVLAIFVFAIYQRATETQEVPTFGADISAIKFIHTDENEGEDIIITSDKKIYQGFSGTTVYFSIDPLLKESEDVAMQFYFTDSNARVSQIYQRKDNAWWALPLSQGGVTNSKFSKSMTRKKEIEGKIYVQSKASFNSLGETEYFMAEIAYTPGTPGQFLIEAFGSSGSYGILDPWYDSGWLYRKKITIDYNKVGSGGVTNFPMLFSRTDVDLKSTGNGVHVASATGLDILFTDVNGTKLDHEIELYTATTGNLIAWVEVPSISASANTTVYIYYGNASAADQSNATGVWDANYKGVWHLPDGTTLNLTDSTSNVVNFTTAGG